MYDLLNKTFTNNTFDSFELNFNILLMSLCSQRYESSVTFFVSYKSKSFRSDTLSASDVDFATGRGRGKTCVIGAAT